jgi:hypothetical protein
MYRLSFIKIILKSCNFHGLLLILNRTAYVYIHSKYI